MARSSRAFVSCFSSPFSPMMSSGFLYSARSLSITSGSNAIVPSSISQHGEHVYTPFVHLHVYLSGLHALLHDAPKDWNLHHPPRNGEQAHGGKAAVHQG